MHDNTTLEKPDGIARIGAHFVDDLSFMQRRPEGGIDYWVVQPTGDWLLDTEKGERLGREYLAYIGRHSTWGNATLLGMIVNDMAVRASAAPSKSWRMLSGIECGFLRAINEHAMALAAIVAGTAVL